jgi:hypothetical protein
VFDLRNHLESKLPSFGASCILVVASTFSLISYMQFLRPEDLRHRRRPPTIPLRALNLSRRMIIGRQVVGTGVVESRASTSDPSARVAYRFGLG